MNSDRAEPRSAASMTVDLDSLFADSGLSSRDSMVNCKFAPPDIQYGAARSFSPPEKAIRLPSASQRLNIPTKRGCMERRVQNRAHVRGNLAFHLFALTAILACKGNPPVARTFPFLQRYSAAPTMKTDLLQMQKDDGQWIMPAKDYASRRFSALNQINASSVKNLKVAWTFSMANDRGEEAAPLVVNKTMYVVSPYP